MIDIRNGDAYEGLKTIKDKSVNLIMIDPPYIIEHIDGTALGREIEFLKEIKNNKDGFLDGYDIEKYHTEFKRIQPFLNMYIFCNVKLLNKLICFYSQFENLSLDILVWHKPNAIPIVKCHYKRDLEYCLFICENCASLKANAETGSKLHTENCQFYKETKHPTEKPLKWIERLLLNSTNKGDLVLDCFSGSGTTAVACKRHDRNFIGFEIDKEYYEMSLKRLNNGVIKPLFENLI